MEHMEWVESLRKSIDLMEVHILEDYDIHSIAREVGISDMYLQKGFKFMTGFTMSEYLRNRRLYLGALDVISGKEKVIDIAYKYGYDTPESFTKAFTRFHGVAPMQLKKEPSRIHVFLPLKIKISIQGGNDMDYVVEKMKGFTIIGFERTFKSGEGYDKAPKFWCEFCNDHLFPLLNKEKPEGEVEEMMSRCNVGEYGVSIDINDTCSGQFRYMIGGVYTCLLYTSYCI